jgi:hypothetical protein
MHKLSLGKQEILPALIVLVLLTILVCVTVIKSGGDPISLARIGTRYSVGNPQGTEGYDGQFAYYIALDPHPTSVAHHLDVPAYRYQRILLPLLIRLISGGDPRIMPWIFPLITIFAQFLGTWVLAIILSTWHVNPWYALTYGLWVGFGLAVRLDLPESLTFALVLIGIYFLLKEDIFFSSLAMGAAVFSKEVAILFIFAVGFHLILNRVWREFCYFIAIAILPYTFFQIWLFYTFGSFGIGSGGAMATSFELVPLMGLFRIWQFSPLYMIMMFIVFIPCTIGPAIWGTYFAGRKLLSLELGLIPLITITNALIIFFLPFSTFRETGGLLRISCGIILATLLMAAKYRINRILNYSFLLIAYNAFLLK